MPRKQKPADGNIVRTMDKAAARLHTTRRTLATWFSSGCPGRVAGGYSVAVINKWARANSRGQYRRGVSGEQSEKQLAELRILQAKASRLELDLQARRGELVDLGEVLRESMRFHTAAREHLQQMASRVLAVFPPVGSTVKEGDHKRVRDDVDRVAETIIAIFHRWLQQRAIAAQKVKVIDEQEESGNGQVDSRPASDRAGRGKRPGGPN